MTIRDIVRLRLASQQLTRSDFTNAGDMVKWMGCIQAQDFGAAKWAIGNRVKTITDSDIEREFNKGNILRIHILRPTWHFITPEDIRWVLKLTAGKVRSSNRTHHQKLGIVDSDLKKSKRVFEKELSGGRQLTRNELNGLLQKKKINTDDIRMAYHLMDAELIGLLCSGAKQGKQFTYALLEERVPVSKSLDDNDAIRELTKRYFQSRGPATLKDFCWWSGLSMQNARQGIEMNAMDLNCEKIKGDSYWFYKLNGIPKTTGIQLLPVYDEYAVGYNNRSAILNPEHNKATGSGIFKPVIIYQGKIAGVWKKTTQKGRVTIEKEFFTTPVKTAGAFLKKAENGYQRFLIG